ncbi:MAG: hypothetical protein HQM12_19785 [SAR324 cluster bacterium]|nr:hypothetical protein [SAR324 cluster bacterium]
MKPENNNEISDKDIIKNRERIERLKQVIAQTGLTQGEFSQEVGYSERTIPTLFNRNGKTPVSETLALAIQAVFGINYTWIMEGELPLKVNGRNLLEAGELMLVEVAHYKDSRVMESLLMQSIQQSMQNNRGDFIAKAQKLEGDDFSKIYEYMAQLSNEQKIIEKSFSEQIEALRNEHKPDGETISLSVIQRIYFDDRWDAIQERSAEYHQLLRLGLKPVFDVAIDNLHPLKQRLLNLYNLPQNIVLKLEQIERKQHSPLIK